MRYADSSASYGYDGSLFERLAVTINYRSNRFDPLRYSNIRQEYQSRVRESPQENELSEVLVHRDEDPVVCSCLLQ